MDYRQYKHVLRMMEKGEELAAQGYIISEAKDGDGPSQFRLTFPERHGKLLPHAKICMHFEEAVAYAAGVRDALAAVNGELKRDIP